MNTKNALENETNEVEADELETLTTQVSSPNDKNLESEVKYSYLKNILKLIRKNNTLVTLLFTFMLVIVSVVQSITYMRQAAIASNANKLSQYEYRFDFYKKIESLQKATSFVMKDPKQSVEEFPELHFKIISLLRESELLFNKDISQNINNILNEHLDFLVFIDNNENINHDNYEKEIRKLNTDYGNFLNSDSFKVYLDINRIE